jgi:TatD DNase family protein
MYIDTHCHLTFPEFDGDRTTVIGNAKKAGVKQFIVPGVSINSSHTTSSYAKNMQNGTYASVGCHPYETKNFPDVRLLEKMLNEKVVAIGECGLDYHAYKGFPAIGKKEEQKQLFEEQLRLALIHNLPVIIHCRDAFEDIFDVLDSLPTLPRGVFHCFCGGPEDVKQVEKRGFYFGIDGNVTYSKLHAITVPLIPLDRILLETDSPLLPPIPHRGERNEPKYIPLIAQKIAELKTCTVKEIEEQTTQNARALFKI